VLDKFDDAEASLPQEFDPLKVFNFELFALSFGGGESPGFRLRLGCATCLKIWLISLQLNIGGLFNLSLAKIII
jgi:hypothetical protein